MYIYVYIYTYVIIYICKHMITYTYEHAWLMTNCAVNHQHPEENGVTMANVATKSLLNDVAGQPKSPHLYHLVMTNIAMV